MNPSFAYIYDTFLNDRKYERDLANLETELARLGIEGKIIRLTMFRQARELIADAVRLGVRNLVFVGNDRTVQSAIPILPNFEVTIGFIPFEKSGVVAQAMGIPVGVSATETLAARRIELFDLGVCGERPFLVDVTVPMPGASLDIEGKYKASSDTQRLEIRNLTGQGAGDGTLDAFFINHQAQGFFARWRERVLGSETHLPLSRGILSVPGGAAVLVDGEQVQGERFELRVEPRKLRCIVGKMR